MAKDNNHYNYTGVLTSEENKQKHYLIVNKSSKGEIILTKLALFLMASTFLILLIGAVIGTYFLTLHLVDGQHNGEENGHHNGHTMNGDDTTLGGDGVASSSLAASSSFNNNNDDKLLRGSLLNLHAPPVVKTPKKYVNYRLPTHMKPTQYRIQLTPYISEGNFTTDGDVSIKLSCLKNAYNITLHINDIMIDERSVNLCQFDYKQIECNSVEIRNHLYDKEAQTYIIIAKEKLIASRNYTINIRFRSKLNDLLQGFYRSYHVDPTTHETRWMASTQFSPTDARRAFPCFDEPSFKSTFKISIARDSTRHTSLSNMQLRKTQQMPTQENWVWDHYEETPIMSTYLVGFVVSDLKPAKRITPTNGNQKVNITYWARESVTNNTMYAQIITPQLLSYFETYFGIPFPLRKQDLVAIPDFGFSAMENWGLITFRESVLLFDDVLSTADSLENTAITIGHELGHQWFGNLVTPAWWDDLWLKEGFANFAAYLGVNEVEKSWQIADQFVLDIIHEALSLDEIKSSHQISIPVNNPADIRQIFDTISYKKGASIIRMMSHYLGETNFRNGLKYYLHKYSYSNAKQDDLWQILNDHATTPEEKLLPENTTVKTIMDSWTLKPGFPIITVIRNYENGTANITQKRFVRTNESSFNNNKEKTLWYIPITYTTQTKPEFNDTRTRLWLTKKENVIENLPKDGWVVFNIQNVGFYRVNYDERNWEMLTERYVNFPEITRTQFINDALSIARANQLDYNIALNMLKQIPKTQQSYLSWRTAITQLRYLYNMLAFSPSFGNYQTFIYTIIQGTYSRFDFTEKPTDPHLVKLHRAQILQLACEMQYEHCTNRAQYLFREWMINNPDPRSMVKPNLKYVVYCTSVREGGEREWDFLFEHYLQSNSGSDKKVILKALACSSQHWLLARYINMTINENSQIRKQDGETVFSSIAENIYGAELALDFLRNNWDRINEYYGEAFNTVSKMVETAHTFLNSPAQLEEILLFKRKHANNLYTSEMAVNNVIEQVLANIEWKKNSYQTVADWLIEFNKIYGGYV